MSRNVFGRSVIGMTAVKEQFMQMLPQIQRGVPRMADSDVRDMVPGSVN